MEIKCRFFFSLVFFKTSSVFFFVSVPFQINPAPNRGTVLLI